MRAIQELAGLLNKAFTDLGSQEERNRIGWEYVRLERSCPRWPKDGLRRNNIKVVSKSIWVALTDSERKEAAVRYKDYLNLARTKKFGVKYLDTWLIDTFGERIGARFPAHLKRGKQGTLFGKARASIERAIDERVERAGKD